MNAPQPLRDMPPASLGRLAWRRLLRDRVGLAALLVTLLFMVFTGLAAAGLVAGH